MGCNYNLWLSNDNLYQMGPEQRELISYFQNKDLPKHPIKLSDWETIIDPKKFVNSHIDILKGNSGCKKPYYDRLVRFKNVLIDINRTS